MRWPSFSSLWFTLGLLIGFVLGWLARPWQAWIQARVRGWRRRPQAGGALEPARQAWVRQQILALQGLHIAAPLAPLDTFVLPPQVTPLGSLLDPEDEPSLSLIHTPWPFIPDAPALDAGYQAPKLTLTEALQGGASLLLLGPYGSGKTVALAWLALRVLQQDDEAVRALNWQWPWWLHASQIAQSSLPEDPLALLFDHLLAGLNRSMQEALRQAWRAAAQQGTAVLLVDGLDETPPSRRHKVIAFLERMARVYPRVRLIVAAAPDAWGPLTRLNLVPVAMRWWDREQAQAFTRRWLAWWEREVWAEWDPTQQPRPEILEAWLLNSLDGQPIAPLEWVLRNWQLAAGDGVGYGWRALLEGWMRRAVPDEEWAPDVWHRLARQQAFPLADEETTHAATPAEDADETPAVERPPEALAHPVVRAAFIHPIAQAWWIAQGLTAHDTRWAQEPWWHLQTWVLGFVGQRGQGDEVAQRLAKDVLQPLFPRFWEVVRAAALAPQAPWARQVLQTLVQRVQQVALPLGQRARAVAALLAARPPRLAALFGALLRHPDPTVHAAACLGLGLLHDPETVVPMLQKYLQGNPSPWQRRLALMALARQDTRPAVEIVAAWLLQEDDLARREAAEALALAPRWGHRALREAAEYDDAMVRRAAVYGLGRIDEPWAKTLLETLARDDPEWLVRNLAGSVLEAKAAPSLYQPRPPKPLHKEPWLLEAASRLGLSVASGPPAWQALAHILQEGSSTERRHALRRVIYLPHERWVPLVASLVSHEDPRVAEDALTALWVLFWAGTRFPLTL